MSYKIGVVGHVDNGKTTLTNALTGIWADRHSEETKRGITIKLGYVNLKIFHCSTCRLFQTHTKCERCETPTTLVQSSTLVDVPGHKNLIMVFLSGVATIDLALIVIDAREVKLSTQTKEHIRGLDILGIRRAIIVHNKIETATIEQMRESFKTIRKFCKGSIAENARIIPISALHQTNIDVLAEEIHRIYLEEYCYQMQLAEENKTKPLLFAVSRSFDINHPGPLKKEIRGGVLGGSLITGTLKTGEIIEIKCGTQELDELKTLHTSVTKIRQFDTTVEEAIAGGVYTIEMTLDPGLTTGDNFAGSLIGRPSELPQFQNFLTIDLQEIEDSTIKTIEKGDVVVVQYLTCTSYGIIQKINHQNRIQVELKAPVCLAIQSQVCLIIKKIMYGGIVTNFHDSR